MFERLRKVDSLECVLLALADTEYFAVRKSVRLAVAGKSHLPATTVYLSA
jgi:hypothetical protein